jgi:hypothetical protein
LSTEDDDLVALVGCTLDRSPKSNWVEDSGGLPEYICRIARAIHRSGKSISQSIAIAVSRVKKWAAGLDDVDADTRAKAAKAVAQWEALKTKNKVKKGAKSAARAAKGNGNVGKRDTRVDLANVLLAAGPLHTNRVSDLDTILKLAAGKPNPFAKGGADTKPNPFAKGGDKSGKKAPPFGKKPGGSGGGDNASGGGLNSAAAVTAAWKRLQANKDLTPEQYAAQAQRIKAAAKKFNVKLG